MGTYWGINVLLKKLQN